MQLMPPVRKTFMIQYFWGYSMGLKSSFVNNCVNIAPDADFQELNLVFI